MKKHLGWPKKRKSGKQLWGQDCEPQFNTHKGHAAMIFMSLYLYGFLISMP